MTALVNFLVKGLVSKPDQVHVNAVEGEASVLLELSVDPQDRDAVYGPEGETLRAIRALLSAASGRRKAVLEVIEPALSESGQSESMQDEAGESSADSEE